ncbi:MAG: hypothetical protein HY898_15395 [Deltaproteobacteria bacterium]|nr:hypothetical protein [Deltaproteobacteria bacterium]
MLRALTLLLVALVGCSSSLPRPATSPHTANEFVDVPFPPPAVRADLVPPRTHDDSVWIDGEWQWQELRWAWRRGSWVVPPGGSTLARWETKRAGTQVRHAKSVFHLADGGSLAPSELRERRFKRPGNPACTSPAPASFEQP